MADDKTAEDMIYKVASILGKHVAGEALGSVESTTIDGCIDPVLAEIEEIVYVGDRDAIPAKYFNTIARLVAVHAAAEFSNTTPDLAVIRQHEDRLRELAASAPTYQVAESEYF